MQSPRGYDHHTPARTAWKLDEGEELNEGEEHNEEEELNDGEELNEGEESSMRSSGYHGPL